jgi:hypothetical protein
MTDAMVVRSFDDTEKVALAMVKSGYFIDAKDASQAIVKIMAGREMGFGPFASMTGVYIIQGRPSIGANLMASAVKRSGRYDYRVLEMTDKVCTIEFYQGGKDIGKSTFTIEDARKAGTKNTDKYPRNMLFARAMSNGVRWFTPDIFDGPPVYTPEELGANVNEQGDVIDIPATPTPSPEKVVTPDVVKPDIVVPEGTAVITDTGTYIYTGRGVKVGHNIYPVQWGRLIMAYTRANQFECDGILQQLRPPFDTRPEDVIDLISAHLANKAQAEQK